MSHPLYAVLPGGLDDPAAPSGGNRYDREVLRHLGTLRGSATRADLIDPVITPGQPQPTASLPAFEVHEPVKIRERPGMHEQPGMHERPGVHERPGMHEQPGVHEQLLAGAWPRPGAAARQALADTLGRIPDGAVVLIDGLVACGVPEILEPHAGRLRLAVLVHLPLSDETGLPPHEATELRALESRALRLATAVIATSTPAARRVEELHDVTGVHAIPPGVEPALPAMPSPGGHRLLNVASLTHRKGQDVLLSALSLLSDLSWTCVVAGAGRLPGYPLTPPATLLPAPRPAPAASASCTPDHSPEWQAAHGAPEDRYVRFAGALAGRDLEDAYANADLFVLPSRAETYGMVVTEALARGIPVLASDVGGVPEALGTAPGGGVPGRLIPPDDPEALAEALRAWLTDPDLRKRWRTDALARRETLTGWDETARRLERVLEDLNRSGPAPRWA